MPDLKKLTVEEYTSPNLMVAKKSDKLLGLAKTMKDKNIRHMPIMDKDEVVGIISQRDLYSIDKEELNTLIAESVMSKNPFLVSKSELIQDVAYEMSNRKIGSAIVTEGNKVFGIFTTTDALNALVEIVRGDTKTNTQNLFKK